MLTYVIMCTVYCTMYLLTVNHRYIPWQCSVWMNGHISCYPRRRAGSEEVYVARQEEVREQEARQRLQHEEDELVRREIQIMAQAKTTFYLSLLQCPWSFWHRNSFFHFPGSNVFECRLLWRMNYSGTGGSVALRWTSSTRTGSQQRLRTFWGNSW